MTKSDFGSPSFKCEAAPTSTLIKVGVPSCDSVTAVRHGASNFGEFAVHLGDASVIHTSSRAASGFTRAASTRLINAATLVAANFSTAEVRR